MGTDQNFQDHPFIEDCVDRLMEHVSGGKSIFFIGPFDPEIVFRCTLSTYLRILKESVNTSPVLKEFSRGDYVLLNNKHTLIYDSDSSAGGMSFKTEDATISIERTLRDSLEKTKSKKKLAKTGKVLHELRTLKEQITPIRKLLNIPVETDVYSAKPQFLYFGNVNRIKSILEEESFYGYGLEELVQIGRVKNNLSSANLISGADISPDIKVVNDAVLLDTLISEHDDASGSYVFINSSFLRPYEVDVIDSLLAQNYPLCIFGQYANTSINEVIQPRISETIIRDERAMIDSWHQKSDFKHSKLEKKIQAVFNRRVNYSIIETDSTELLLSELNSLRPLIKESNNDLRKLLIYYYGLINTANADIFKVLESSYQIDRVRVSSFLSKQQHYLSEEDLAKVELVGEQISNYLANIDEIHQLKLKTIVSTLKPEFYPRKVQIYSSHYKQLEGTDAEHIAYQDYEYHLLGDLETASQSIDSQLYIISPPVAQTLLRPILGNGFPLELRFVLLHNEYRKLQYVSAESFAKLKQLDTLVKGFSGNSFERAIPDRLLAIPDIPLKRAVDKPEQENIDTLFDSINNELTRQYEAKNEGIETKKIDFFDGSFMYASETHKFNRISMSDRGISGISIRRLPLPQLKVGHIIVDLETEHSIITEYANELLQKDGHIKNLDLSTLRKDALRKHCAKGTGFNTLTRAFGKQGISHDLVTIRNWIRDDYLIGPRDLSVIDAVAEITSDERVASNINQIKESIIIVRRYHMKASSLLRNELMDELQEIQYDDISETLSRAEIYDKINDKLGTIRLLMVKDIDPQLIHIEFNYANRVLD